MVDSLGTTAYSFDAPGQLLTEDGPFASDTVIHPVRKLVSREADLSPQRPESVALCSPAVPFSHGVNTYSNRRRVALSLQQLSGSWTNGFTWDSAGRMSAVTSPAGESDYNHTKNELTNAFGATDSYDANGNLTSGTNGHVVNVYDDENRLKQWIWYATDSAHCSDGALRTDFTYDGLGRLRKRVEYVITGGVGGGGAGAGSKLAGCCRPRVGGCSWGTGTETRYIYDGMRVIYPVRRPEDVTCSAQYASLGPLALRTILGLSHGGQECDGSNNPQVAYTRGKDLSGSLEGAGGIGGLLARSTWGGSSWSSHALYHADGNGNVTKLIDSGSEASVATYRYDPFGNTLSSSDTLSPPNVYRFSSKELHLASGMYYYGYRFYDPSRQRWLNRDPLLELGGINLYELALNDPIGICDPLGLKDDDKGGSTLKRTVDFLKKAASACKQWCKQKIGGSPATSAAGAATRVIDTAAKGAQAGPGLTLIAAIQAACQKCKDCRGDPAVECDAAASRDCDAACDFCEKQKNKLHHPAQGLLH